MAERGDVFQLIRRLGFGAGQEGERVVIVQADALNSVLPTLLVVPLEANVELFAASPLAVRVSGAECGAGRVEHVAMPPWIRVIRGDHLAPGRVGRFKPRSLAELSTKLRLILDL